MAASKRAGCAHLDDVRLIVSLGITSMDTCPNVLWCADCGAIGTRVFTKRAETLWQLPGERAPRAAKAATLNPKARQAVIVAGPSTAQGLAARRRRQ